MINPLAYYNVVTNTTVKTCTVHPWPCCQCSAFFVCNTGKKQAKERLSVASFFRLVFLLLNHLNYGFILTALKVSKTLFHPPFFARIIFFLSGVEFDAIHWNSQTELKILFKIKKNKSNVSCKICSLVIFLFTSVITNLSLQFKSFTNKFLRGKMLNIFQWKSNSLSLDI